MRASEEIMYRKAWRRSSPRWVREAVFLSLNAGLGIHIHQAPARAAGRHPPVVHVPMHQPINADADSWGCGVTALLRNIGPLQADPFIKEVVRAPG
jgi:hypothetical protein